MVAKARGGCQIEVQSARPGWIGTASARLTARFCVLFVLLIVLFSSITSTRFVGVVLHDHLTRSTVVWALRLKTVHVAGFLRLRTVAQDLPPTSLLSALFVASGCQDL